MNVGRVVPVRVALALVTFILPGCTGWVEQREMPAEVIATERPDQVRILALTDGVPASLIVTHPRIVADSLVGLRGGMEGDPRLAIALSDIRIMDVHKTDPGRTTALIAGIGATILLMTFVISASSIGTFGAGY